VRFPAHPAAVGGACHVAQDHLWPGRSGPSLAPNTTFFEVVSEVVSEVVFSVEEVVLARA
jgi:hypothetical protein